MPHTNTDLTKCQCDDCVAFRARPRVSLSDEPLTITTGTTTVAVFEVQSAPGLGKPITIHIQPDDRNQLS